MIRREQEAQGSRSELKCRDDRVLEVERLAAILEEEFKRLLEILHGEIGRPTLAGHLDLKAASDEPIAFVGDWRSELHTWITGEPCVRSSEVNPTSDAQSRASAPTWCSVVRPIRDDVPPARR